VGYKLEQVCVCGGGRGIGIGIGNIDRIYMYTHTHRWQRVKDNTKYSDVITDEKNPLASESKYFRGRGIGLALL
jgi:hypothetical protein